MAGELAIMSSPRGRTQVPTALQMSMQLNDMLDQKAGQGAADAEAQRHTHTQLMLEEERRRGQDLVAEVSCQLACYAHLGMSCHMLMVCKELCTSMYSMS